MHALCWARPHRHYFHPKGINIMYSLPKIKNSLVKEHVALLVTFSMLGKLAITSSYGTVYIFSAELFPTVVRNVGMGTASLSARIGGILCPYINMLRWNNSHLFNFVINFNTFQRLLDPSSTDHLWSSCFHCVSNFDHDGSHSQMIKCPMPS